jgi:putative membrane protein
MVLGVWPVTASSVQALHLGEFAPPLLASAAYLTVYFARLRTLSRQGRPVPGWRVGCFTAGAALVAIVQLPPLDGAADEVLAIHMAQHMIIGELATLLIALGLTGPVLAPVLRLRVSHRLRRLANPITALSLWALNLYAWHLPLLYQLAIRHDVVHALEHACLLWFGLLLWLALLGPLPKPAWFHGWAELGYVFSVRFAGAVLGNALIWAQSVVYPIYRASDAARGLSPLSDQNLAGAVMMVEQMLLTAALVAWLFLRWARREEERQQLLDVAARRGVSLSPERAERAVLGGGARRLRALLVQPALGVGVGVGRSPRQRAPEEARGSVTGAEARPGAPGS